MKELPLLSSEYALFEWNNSNGSATAEQTQRGYTALISQGQTAAFSRFVWNDLVDKLYNALIASGLSWNNYYGTAENTKINAQYGELTANRFNAVRYNIESLINTNWKWSFDKSLEGYLGRLEIRGYSQYGLDGDFVYGWYIVELARVLNVFLNILKNEADFSELLHQKSISTLTQAPLYAGLSAPFFYQNSIHTTQEAQFYAGAAGYLTFHGSILSDERVDVELVPTKPMYIQVRSATCKDANIEYKTPLTMAYRFSSATTERAILKDAIYVGRMVHRASSKTNYNAEMLFTDVVEALIRDVANSMENSTLLCNTPALFDYYQTSISRYFADMDKRSSMMLVGKGRLITRENGQIANIEPNYMTSQGLLFSKYSAKSQMFRSRPVYSMLENELSQLWAEVLGRTATHFVFTGKSFAKESNDFSALESKKIASGTTIRGTERVDCIPRQPYYLSVQDKTVSNEHAQITQAVPVFAEVGESIFSHHFSEVIRNVATKARAQLITQTSRVADMVRWGSKNIDALGVISSSVKAVLSFYKEEPENGWYDPVQTGTNLYVRSAYPQWQEANNVHLDSGGVFEEPVQTGTDLYIRSNESMKEVIKDV